MARVWRKCFFHWLHVPWHWTESERSSLERRYWSVLNQTNSTCSAWFLFPVNTCWFPQQSCKKKVICWKPLPHEDVCKEVHDFFAKSALWFACWTICSLTAIDKHLLSEQSEHCSYPAELLETDTKHSVVFFPAWRKWPNCSIGAELNRQPPGLMHGENKQLSHTILNGQYTVFK